MLKGLRNTIFVRTNGQARRSCNVDECRRVWDDPPCCAAPLPEHGVLFNGASSDLDLPHLELWRKANIVPLSIHIDALSAAGLRAEVADV